MIHEVTKTRLKFKVMISYVLQTMENKPARLLQTNLFESSLYLLQWTVLADLGTFPSNLAACNRLTTAVVTGYARRPQHRNISRHLRMKYFYWKRLNIKFTIIWCLGESSISWQAIEKQMSIKTPFDAQTSLIYCLTHWFQEVEHTPHRKKMKMPYR